MGDKWAEASIAFREAVYAALDAGMTEDELQEALADAVVDHVTED